MLSVWAVPGAILVLGLIAYGIWTIVTWRRYHDPGEPWVKDAMDKLKSGLASVWDFANELRGRKWDCPRCKARVDRNLSRCPECRWSQDVMISTGEATRFPKR